MMTDLVVAIDVGTSGVRSMVSDTEGRVVARGYEEFKSEYPHPSWVEQDADAWWRTACSTLKRCLSSEGVSPERVAAVSVTNQRETIVPVEEDGSPLRRAIVWQDRRTVAECQWLREHVTPETIYSVTGLTVDPYFSAPKLLWLKTHEPDVFRAAHKFLLVHDFVVHRLCGEYVTDYSNASRTMLFDIARGQWSETLLGQMGITPELLPRAVPSGTQVGEVGPDAARETGLATGTPVVAGGGDQQCAALGVGVVRPGSVKATTGTGTFLLAFSQSVRLDPGRRLLCSRHVVPDTFVVEASMFTTGAALRWFRDNLAPKECEQARQEASDPYDLLMELAATAPPGAGGVLHIPHFVGAGAPHWNPHARAVFAGIALGHSRAHLLRAVLEGVAMEIRTNVEVMRSIGIPVRELRVTGGAARSRFWMQVQSNVLGVPIVRTALEEATSLGAAVLACIGAGIFQSAVEAVDRMVRPADTLAPDPEERDLYDTLFARYSALYRALSDIDWPTD